MKYVPRCEVVSNNYRKVEAMYRKGCTIAEIVRGTELIDLEVFDVIQKIFALDCKKQRERVGLIKSLFFLCLNFCENMSAD